MIAAIAYLDKVIPQMDTPELRLPELSELPEPPSPSVASRTITPSTIRAIACTVQ
jgi:hypothetical protein